MSARSPLPPFPSLSSSSMRKDWRAVVLCALVAVRFFASCTISAHHLDRATRKVPLTRRELLGADCPVPRGPHPVTSYSLQMYGPDYWKSWTREAVEGTEAAMTELLAADHAEQVGHRVDAKRCHQHWPVPQSASTGARVPVLTGRARAHTEVDGLTGGLASPSHPSAPRPFLCALHPGITPTPLTPTHAAGCLAPATGPRPTCGALHVPNSRRTAAHQGSRDGR